VTEKTHRHNREPGGPASISRADRAARGPRSRFFDAVREGVSWVATPADKTNISEGQNTTITGSGDQAGVLR